MRIIYTSDSKAATSAAAEFATKLGCSTVTELVEVLYPDKQWVSPRAFNVCSDAMHSLKKPKRKRKPK